MPDPAIRHLTSRRNKDPSDGHRVPATWRRHTSWTKPNFFNSAMAASLYSGTIALTRNRFSSAKAKRSNICKRLGAIAFARSSAAPMPRRRKPLPFVHSIRLDCSFANQPVIRFGADHEVIKVLVLFNLLFEFFILLLDHRSRHRPRRSLLHHAHEL